MYTIVYVVAVGYYVYNSGYMQWDAMYTVVYVVAVGYYVYNSVCSSVVAMGCYVYNSLYSFNGMLYIQ